MESNPLRENPVAGVLMVHHNVAHSIISGYRHKHGALSMVEKRKTEWLNNIDILYTLDSASLAFSKIEAKNIPAVTPI